MGDEGLRPFLTKDQLDVIQGDIWSKGFPKYYETYYFFAIKDNKAPIFAQSLKELAQRSPPLISSLSKVKKDRELIRQQKVASKGQTAPLFSVTNALIAFTAQGLETIQAGLRVKDSLDLNDLKFTDPAFYYGMGREKFNKEVGDPPVNEWEPLHKSPKIHGLLKIAGRDKSDVDKHLAAIKDALKYGTAMDDAHKAQPPTPNDSRVDGWTRPNDRGKEHFGFEDGISQPLMGGIDDELEPWPAPNLNVNPRLIIITDKTNREMRDIDRPKWTLNGSFLVFRKLQQNVAGFEALTKDFKKYRCKSEAHMAAKLMGRWKSGAPIVKFPTEDAQISNIDMDDPATRMKLNGFDYTNETNDKLKKYICPVSAHIRKTNIREIVNPNDGDWRAKRTKIVRAGIPYGPDYNGPTDSSTRGLLFVCYQGSLEDGFEHMQANWSNNILFRFGNPGHDPIIGQNSITGTSTRSTALKTQMTDSEGNSSGFVEFEQLVTLKGGGYFFVPSIKSLREELSDVSK